MTAKYSCENRDILQPPGVRKKCHSANRNLLTLVTSCGVGSGGWYRGTAGGKTAACLLCTRSDTCSLSARRSVSRRSDARCWSSVSTCRRAIATSRFGARSRAVDRAVDTMREAGWLSSAKSTDTRGETSRSSTEGRCGPRYRGRTS